MEQRFDTDGHLTQYAFEALYKDENLSELDRLEIAEHLSFCDDCIVRYGEYLSGLELEKTPACLKQNIYFRLKRKTTEIIFSRYGSVAVAASFSIILWVSGVFKKPFENTDKFKEKAGLVMQAADEMENFWGKLNYKINTIDLRGDR